jgi:hypothetical protein
VHIILETRGEVEYALTKPEWEARTAGQART